MVGSWNFFSSLEISRPLVNGEVKIWRFSYGQRDFRKVKRYSFFVLGVEGRGDGVRVVGSGVSKVFFGSKGLNKGLNSEWNSDRPEERLSTQSQDRGSLGRRFRPVLFSPT